MSRKTRETPVSILDYDGGIGRELDDLRGIGVLCELANENRQRLALNEDERETLFAVIRHTIERLDAKVREVEAMLRGDAVSKEEG